MARGKQTKLAPWMKLANIMLTGKTVTVDEIQVTLGNEIHMYRLSTYIWCIKTDAGGVVKVVKDGRKAVGYQLMNTDEVVKYFNKNGISMVVGATVAKAKTKSVKKLADLGAQETATETVETVTETATAEQTS
jgi:hypothetical protein